MKKMKTYFNAADRTRHIILLAMQTTCEEMSKSPTLTGEERRHITKAFNEVEAFNRSLFERMGEPYANKIQRTMESNALRLVGKYSSYTEAISNAAAQDLEPAINDLRTIHCLDCERCDFTKCGVYAISVACDIKGEDTDGCPYKI